MKFNRIIIGPKFETGGPEFGFGGSEFEVYCSELILD